MVVYDEASELEGGERGSFRADIDGHHWYGVLTHEQLRTE